MEPTPRNPITLIIAMLLIALMPLSAGQTLVVCFGPGGHYAIETAHHGVEHVDDHGAATPGPAATPDHGCHDMVLAVDLLMASSREQRTDIACAPPHVPPAIVAIPATPCIAAARMPSRPRAHKPLASPQRALRTIILLI